MFTCTTHSPLTDSLLNRLGPNIHWPSGFLSCWALVTGLVNPPNKNQPWPWTWALPARLVISFKSEIWRKKLSQFYSGWTHKLSKQWSVKLFAKLDKLYRLALGFACTSYFYTWHFVHYTTLYTYTINMSCVRTLEP